MILTLTLNTGLDHVLFVAGYEWGRTIRAHASALTVGAKGIDVSWILGELGQPNMALGWVAGEIGKWTDAALRAQGALTDFVWVGGETRLNTVVVYTVRKAQSTITVNTLVGTAEHLQEAKAKIAAHLPEASCLMLGGRLPEGVSAEFYGEVITMARDHRVPTILDASGAGLRAGVQAGPTVVKPNRDELQEWAGRPLASREDYLQAAREMLACGVDKVVVTLGREGAMAVSAEEVYLIQPIEVPIVNTAGAGDGFVAGLCTMYESGLSWEDGLRLGMAAATAVVLTPGTAECRREDVYRFLPQVRLESI